MKARKFNWVLNALTLAAMALALVVSPITPASAGVEVVMNADLRIYPPNAQAFAHYVFMFQVTRSVPMESTLYVKFPIEQYDPNGDGLWDDSKIPDLTYDTGDPNLNKMLVTWGPGMVDIFDEDFPNDIPATATQSAPPLKSFAWRNPAVNWLEDGEVRMATPVEDIPEGYYVRMDFWGPANINPGEMNAGIENPDEEGNYCWYVATDEEVDWVEICRDIEPPFPVRLYRKYQIPLDNCGYTWLDYVRGFETIQAALGAANLTWLNDGDYVDEPFWNLFADCPDLAELDPDDNAAFLTAATKGVAVGAVIMVEPGIYEETLDMDTPGVILGSTEGPEVTIVEANNVDDIGVDISAGGITFGASEFDVGEADPLGLQGFTVRNAGAVGANSNDGVYVWPHGEKCVGTDVFDGVAQGWGLLSTTNYTITQIGAFSDTLVLFNEDFEGFWNFEHDGAKLANLTTGWAGHVALVNCLGPGDICMHLYAGLPDEDLIEVNEDRFGVGDAIAVFYPTDHLLGPNYFCPDARVDIRDNIIHDNSDNGIEVFSASVWVDNNEVFSNFEDGFFGMNLKCCNGVMAQDGINRTDKMLEISNNNFHDNGYAADDDGWSDDGECFAPDGGGEDSGIEIWNTVPGECEEHLYIHDNVIQNNVHAGIWLQEGAALCGIRILWNEILDNGVFGVSNEADTVWRGRLPQLPEDWGDFEEPTTKLEVDVIFRYNDVAGNAFWGVKNWAEPDFWFNAKENFWGMAGGPSIGPAPCRHEYDQRYAEEEMRPQGYGDAVSKGTFYNPWLSVNAKELLGMPYQHLRAYGSDSLQLQAGWNTLAVPLPLDSAADDLQEICGLGTYMMVDDVPKWEVAFQYDNVAEAWDAIDGFDPKPIVAVHGYFIKMWEPTRFPVVYGKTLVDLPAYDLVPGWNLIGSAFGIDRIWEGENGTPNDQGRWAVADPDDGDAEAYMDVTDALESIIDWQGQGGLSMIIDPWVPGQIDKGWPAPAVTRQQAQGLDMAAGEAYWVYMKTEGALGGFEYAPLFFNGNPPLPAK